ncbi:uncharacterized protein [Arachis hypogaea]|uniref:uncharacterized protein n=1 Tax=Arachis hypogaea TaxID=3818 RepID=UPI003B226272
MFLRLIAHRLLHRHSNHLQIHMFHVYRHLKLGTRHHLASCLASWLQKWVNQSCNVSEVPPPKSTHQNVLTQGQRSLDTRIRFRSPSGNSGGRLSVDSSRSEGGRGIANSDNSHRIQMGLIEESMRGNDVDDVDYLVDSPDGNNEDDDDDDEEEEDNEDNEVDDGQHGEDDDCGDDPGPSIGWTGTEIGGTSSSSVGGKGYNLRVDPPRRSANRFTPSTFTNVAKKYKNFCKYVKGGMRR